MALMRLGTVLRKWRATEERSLRDVAKEIGIDNTRLSRVERGNDCNMDTLAAILIWLIGKGKGERNGR